MYSEDIFEDNVIKVRNTILEMLEDRGIQKDNLPLNMKYSYLKYMISEFKNDNPVLDIFAKQDNKKIYVKFINKIEKKSNTTNYANLVEISKILIEANRINKDDSVIIVIFDPEFDRLKFFNTEQLLPVNVSVFNYKSLLYNISKHPLVPIHIKLSEKERKEIKTKFMLNSYSNLPTISYADPVCKYYGFKPTDVIKIIRRSNFAKEYVVYKLITGYMKYKREDAPDEDNEDSFADLDTSN